ncbi:MAG TPA: hypothetical protein VK762_05450, partial [Polyangiaceae bacterium]|nr:hypothetical protein [Polyangiaceae bacterium]
FTQSGGWTSSTLSGSTGAGVALRLSGPGSGVGAIQSGSTNDVAATNYSAGAWSSLDDLAVSTGGAPTLAAAGGVTYLAYQAPSFFYYFGIRGGGVWNAANEPVGGSGSSQRFGPLPPSLAVAGGQPVIAFIDGTSSQIVVQTRASGVWQSAQSVAAAPATTSVAPVVVAGTASDPFDLMVVFPGSAGALEYATRVGGSWSSAAAIANALTNQTPSAAVTPAGTVLLAYRGQDGNAYFDSYSSGSWAPTSPIGPSPATSVASTPAVAPGIGSAQAEVVYLDSLTGGAHHTRLVGGSWTAPVLVGGSGLTSVAIDSDQSVSPAPAQRPWTLVSLGISLVLIGSLVARRRIDREVAEGPV